MYDRKYKSPCRAGIFRGYRVGTFEGRRIDNMGLIMIEEGAKSKWGAS